MFKFLGKKSPGLKKKIVLVAVFILFLILLLLGVYLFVSADEVTFAGGTGTSGDPYQIEDCQQLQLTASTTYLSAYFIVNNDIDCSATNPADPGNSGSVWDNGGRGFAPIGTSTTNTFKGNFNGNGKKIIDLYISRTNSTNTYNGLFGYVTSSGVITKVGLVDASITGYNNTGGLAGFNKGTISKSYAIADVYVTYNASAAYGGGLVGRNEGTVSDCYARGTIDGAYTAPYVGGLIGNHVVGASLTNSYAATVIKKSNANTGLIAYPSSPGTTTASFWDINVAGVATSRSGTGATTTALHTTTTYTNVSWDFVNTWAIDASKNNGYPYLRDNDVGADTIVQISSATDLQNIKDNPGKRYIQTADIDASDTVNWNSGEGFDPIDIFYGQYDGNGKVITGLVINTSTADYIGVFGQNRGIVSKMKLGDSDITGDSYVGTIAGYNWGYIRDSSAYLLNNPHQINGYSNTGGLVGWNDVYGTISESYAIADTYVRYLSASAYGGGLVGRNEGTISDCYARGTIDSPYSAPSIGGLIGNHIAGASLTNSYAAVVINKSSDYAGLISYPTTPGTVTASFWDINVAGTDTSRSGTGATTTALHTTTTYTNVSWDFVNTWAIDASKNNGYPYLRDNDVGADTIVQISSATDLQNIKDNPGKRYIQTADIDASDTVNWNSGEGFDPIDIFYGQYDGNGKVITGLVINTSTADYIGVFGQNRGIVSKMKLGDSDITGDSYVGTIAGYNWGYIRDSSAYLLNNPHQINGYSNTGGLVGWNDVYGTISESYAIADTYVRYLSASAYGGGLVGMNEGGISDCYARGTIDGAYSAPHIGGLIGYHAIGANLTNSYAAVVINKNSALAGLISYPTSPGTVTASFWDIDVSGTASSRAGTGTTTLAMKTESTFVDAGWDFEDVWYISASGNDGYPFLDKVYLYPMEGDNWIITQDSINFYGGYGESDSYKLEDTGGEIGTGYSSSTNYLMHAGYQQMYQDIYLSLTVPDPTTLTPAIGGLTGGTADGIAIVNVLTNNNAGYSLLISASTSPAMQHISESATIANYSTSGSDPDYDWAIAATDSAFGFSPYGADVTTRYYNNGSACNQSGGSNSAGKCWEAVPNTNTLISESHSANDPSGTDTQINYRAESGSAHLQPSGTYQATIVVTAYSN